VLVGMAATPSNIRLASAETCVEGTVDDGTCENKSQGCSGKAFVTYVDMVADLFHYGHSNFLKQCRTYCEEQAKELNRPEGCHLLVGIHSDKDVESYKRVPVLTMEERILSVEGSKYVTKVIPNAPLVADHMFLDGHCINALMHGDDNEDEVIYAAAIQKGIFKTVPYTKGISTTELVKRVKKANWEKKI